MPKKHPPVLPRRQLAILIAGLFIAGTPFSALAGETITYDGNASLLQTAPSFFGTNDTLFPGTTAAPAASGNTVTVDYVTGTGTDPTVVFGGLSESGTVSGNSVNLIRGRIQYDVYGGWSISGNATGNTGLPPQKCTAYSSPDG